MCVCVCVCVRERERERERERGTEFKKRRGRTVSPAVLHFSDHHSQEKFVMKFAECHSAGQVSFKSKGWKA